MFLCQLLIERNEKLSLQIDLITMFKCGSVPICLRKRGSAVLHYLAPVSFYYWLFFLLYTPAHFYSYDYFYSKLLCKTRAVVFNSYQITWQRSLYSPAVVKNVPKRDPMGPATPQFKHQQVKILQFVSLFLA